MPNQPCSSSCTPSTAVKLIQAAALAAALVPLGSIQSEAASITCGFGGSETAGSGCGSTIVGSASYTTFNFGDVSSGDDYKVGLRFFFAGDLVPFDLTVTDTLITQSAFDARVDPSLGSYDCVTLVDPSGGDPGCRVFTFVARDPETGEPLSEPVWSSYDSFFSWLFDTEGTYPNGTGDLGQVRVLQDPDATAGNLFTIDMCQAALDEVANYEICVYTADAFDPTIRSGDTRFSDQIVAWTNTSVPEPASLVLLGTGLAGLLSRKRSIRRG